MKNKKNKVVKKKKTTMVTEGTHIVTVSITTSPVRVTHDLELA